MATNQPPNPSSPQDGNEGPPAHGASAAPVPPPYGRPPGDHAQGPAGNEQNAQQPGWNQGYPGSQSEARPEYQYDPYGYQAQQAYPPPPAGYYEPVPPPGAYPPGYPAYYYGWAPPKSRLAAGLLGIFLGGLGIHRFYLGYNTLGIVQILVTCFTFGLGAVWGFVEGIMILAGAQPFQADARGVPLRE